MSLKRSILALTVATGLAAFAVPAFAQDHSHDVETPPKQKWSFSGPFGKFDRAQLQRGFKVYREVCSACHSLELIAFRNLADQGGPEFSAAQAAVIAGEYKVPDAPNDAGEVVDRAARVADYFPKPFPNENAGRAANGGAYPPDLSVMAKARTYERGFPWFLIDIVTQFQEQGPDYVTALLTGYAEKPAHFELPDGSAYNKYFPGNAIKMPPPLSDGRVEYTDGSPATTLQYAKDVTAFLMWTAEPKLEARKRLGFQVMIFLLVFAGLLYFTKKKVWKQVALHPEDLKPRDPAPGEYRPH